MPIILLAAAFAIHNGIKPTNGPALELRLGNSAKLVSSKRLSTWANGVYFTHFVYKMPETTESVRKKLVNRYGFPHQTTQPDHSVNLWRFKHGLYQNVYLSHDSDRQTSVIVDETIDFDQSPEQWFRKNIAPNPPVPMIEIPFLKGFKTTGVKLDDLRTLTSGRGIYREGDDAQTFVAVVKSSYSTVRSAMQEWAKANGYEETVVQSFFKPHQRIFEVEAYPMGEKGKTVINLYTSSKDVDQPVARMKF